MSTLTRPTLDLRRMHELAQEAADNIFGPGAEAEIRRDPAFLTRPRARVAQVLVREAPHVQDRFTSALRISADMAVAIRSESHFSNLLIRHVLGEYRAHMGLPPWPNTDGPRP